MVDSSGMLLHRLDSATGRTWKALLTQDIAWDEWPLPDYSANRIVPLD